MDDMLLGAGIVRKIPLEGSREQALEAIDALPLTPRQRERLRDAVMRGDQWKTSQMHAELQTLTGPAGLGSQRTLNNQLSELKGLGLVTDSRTGEAKDHFWSLGELTMERLFGEGACESVRPGNGPAWERKVGQGGEGGQEESKDMAEHLRTALDFYSVTSVLGEVGMFLKDRLEEAWPGDESGPLRFRSVYFMHSLNDFNLSDVLGAMENRQWCRVQYRHGTKKETVVDMLVFPLKVKVSERSGRQTLLGYEPFHRRLAGLRLDFIDSICVCEDQAVRKILRDYDPSLDEETLEKDLQRARYLIGHTWGVSVPGGLLTGELQRVSLTISYDPQKEYFIPNRCRKECRRGICTVRPEKGEIEVSLLVTDRKEMKPWIRSFYGRIRSVEGREMQEMVREDVEEFLDSLGGPPRRIASAAGHDPLWVVPDEISRALGKGKEAGYHEALFHEAFGVYSYIIADVLQTLGRQESFDSGTLGACLKESIGRYRERLGTHDPDGLAYELRRYLLDVSLVRKEGTRYRPGYRFEEDTRFYWNVIPLTVLEVRWLKTVLADERARCFLSEAELRGLQATLERHHPDVPPLPLGFLDHFDRYHPIVRGNKEAMALPVLLEAIREGRTVELAYRTVPGRMVRGRYEPVRLVFSRRDDQFQGQFLSCRTKAVVTMNLNTILEARLLEEASPIEDREELLEASRHAGKRSIGLSFTSQLNLPDRILTQFSPWEKRCSYEKETDRFSLTIFYREREERDILVRLMGFGGTIGYAQKDHPLVLEIRRRLKAQMSLLGPEAAGKPRPEGKGPGRMDGGKGQMDGPGT